MQDKTWEWGLGEASVFCVAEEEERYSNFGGEMTSREGCYGADCPIESRRLDNSQQAQRSQIDSLSL